MEHAIVENDLRFMRRALRVAMGGRGAVEPNPMVGCVIVREGRIIGDGFHPRYGGPHAEPTALAACSESPRGATAYITLEPCCHTQKKTPPCVPALIEAGVARVVIGCLDPNPAVNGRGVAMLREAGVDVAGPVLEAEAKQLIAPFLVRVAQRRPYVTLKWAQSADGKVAGPAGRRTWISNEHSRRVVHDLRSRCDAVLVGINTVLNDDPLLTARVERRLRPQRRVVIDTHLQIPLDRKLVQSARACDDSARCRDGEGVVVYCSQAAYAEKKRHAEALVTAGVSVAPLPVDESGHVSLPAVLADLAVDTVTHVLVEPGPTLAAAMLRQNLADRVWIFRSTATIGDPTAPDAVSVAYPEAGRVELSGDVLSEYLNPTSNGFFGLFPSADLVLNTP